MEPVLYGPLNLTRITAGALPPGDIRKLYAGYLWRQERALDQTTLITLAIHQSQGSKVKFHKMAGREYGESRISGYIKRP